jgi:hypothetical protein
MLRRIYFETAVPRGRKSVADLIRKKKKESPLVSKSQNTALQLKPVIKNVGAASKYKLTRHYSVAGSKGRRHTGPHST